VRCSRSIETAPGTDQLKVTQSADRKISGWRSGEEGELQSAAMQFGIDAPDSVTQPDLRGLLLRDQIKHSGAGGGTPAPGIT
jgi:hypothetical protein